MKTIIHSNQSRVISGWQGSVNICPLIDLIVITKYKWDPTAIFSLDMCKAFDKMKLNIIFTVLLKYAGFFNFVHWMKIVFKNPILVLWNGLNCESFLVKGGKKNGGSSHIADLI